MGNFDMVSSSVILWDLYLDSQRLSLPSKIQSPIELQVPKNANARNMQIQWAPTRRSLPTQSHSLPLQACCRVRMEHSQTSSNNHIQHLPDRADSNNSDSRKPCLHIPTSGWCIRKQGCRLVRSRQDSWSSVPQPRYRWRHWWWEFLRPMQCRMVSRWWQRHNWGWWSRRYWFGRWDWGGCQHVFTLNDWELKRKGPRKVRRTCKCFHCQKEYTRESHWRQWQN